MINNLKASRAEKVAAIAAVTPVGRKTNIVRTRLNKWKLQHVDGLNETGMPPQCIIMARALNVLAENQTEIDVAGINEMLLNSGLVTRQEPIRIFKYYVHDLESTGILVSQNVPAKPKSKVDPAELTDTDESEVPNAELDQAFADKI